MKIVYGRDCVVCRNCFFYKDIYVFKNLQNEKYCQIKLTKICSDCSQKKILGYDINGNTCYAFPTMRTFCKLQSY